MTKVGLVQCSAKLCLENNFRTLENFVVKAKEKNCQVICFPEASLTGYSMKNIVGNGICQDSFYLEKTQELAKKYKIDIIIGFMERENDNFFMTQGIFRANGTKDFYRKTHLGDSEKEILTSGDSLDIFTLTNGEKIGIALCVENHFPEIIETYSLKGAEMIFAPFAVPRISGDREKIWEKYIRARAYDNRVFMLCLNQWDKEHFGGGIYVVDPAGEVLSSCFNEGEQLLTVNIDLEEIKKYHNENSKMKNSYYPAKRRKDLYI